MRAVRLLAALLAAHAGCGAAFVLSATPLPTVFAGPAEGTSSWVPGRPRSARPAASARACETRPTAGPGQARESRRDIIHKTGSAAATLLLVPAAAGAADFARVRGLPSFHSLAPAAGARACQRQALFPRPLLTVWPCVAALQATEIFGSDGDAPPSFAEQWAAKVGKTMDKNFIDKRRPPPVRCGRT